MLWKVRVRFWKVWWFYKYLKYAKQGNMWVCERSTVKLNIELLLHMWGEWQESACFNLMCALFGTSSNIGTSQAGAWTWELCRCVATLATHKSSIISPELVLPTAQTPMWSIFHSPTLWIVKTFVFLRCKVTGVQSTISNGYDPTRTSDFDNENAVCSLCVCLFPQFCRQRSSSIRIFSHIFLQTR
jgi:hypothetical protein